MDRIITILTAVGERTKWTAWWFGAPIDPRPRPREGIDTGNGSHAQQRTLGGW